MRDQFSSTGTVLPSVRVTLTRLGRQMACSPSRDSQPLWMQTLSGQSLLIKAMRWFFTSSCTSYLINTCTVTAVADRKNRTLIRRLRQIDAAHHLAVDPYFRGAIGGAAMGQQQPQGAAYYGRGNHCP
jgi:hypothetical protein